MAPADLLSRPYSLAEACVATPIKPGAFKQLVHRKILAPAHRPPPGAHRGYRLVEIYSAALIMELAKRGYLQMQAAHAVANIVMDNKFWSHRDLNNPSLLLVYPVSENRATGVKVRSRAELSAQTERILINPAFPLPVVSATLLNVTKVLSEVDNRLRELVTASDEQAETEGD